MFYFRLILIWSNVGGKVWDQLRSLSHAPEKWPYILDFARTYKNALGKFSIFLYCYTVYPVIFWISEADILRRNFFFHLFPSNKNVIKYFQSSSSYRTSWHSFCLFICFLARKLWKLGRTTEVKITLFKGWLPSLLLFTYNM